MELRKFTDAQYAFYKEQHIHQTYEYALQKRSKNYCTTMKMSDALKLLDSFVDPSDPDVSVANSIHAYQTAERIRKEHPNNFELQICGLIHDLGKILFSFGEPSWAVVGDTFVVGCEFPKSIVFYDTLKLNPDFNHPVYGTENGIYKEKCGIENLVLSHGHDEYLYNVLQKNQDNHYLSKKYQNVIRFHSFYPWHTAGEYVRFECETDENIKQDVLEFNKYDLYSKMETNFVLTNEIQEYYDKLLNKFFPDDIHF